jgi:ribosomal-protein-alanine N-acetyltransferase
MSVMKAGDCVGPESRSPADPGPADPGPADPGPADPGPELARPTIVAPAVTIVALRRRHLRAVLRIEAQTVHHGWSIGLYLAELRREHDRLYVAAKVGSQVVGFAGVLFQDGDAHVTTVGVDDRWQRHGIATRMMLVLARRARAVGAAHLTLEVRSSNAAAVALYRRFGLAPAGVRQNYYSELGEDALIMWAHDIDSAGYAQRLEGIEARIDGPTVVEGMAP